MAQILIVDDSQLMRKILRRALERAGHTVTEATGGGSAVALYAKSRPDVAIVDMMMPGMDGLGLLTAIKELDPNARTLVVTADAQETTLAAVMEAGACGLIGKPYTESQIQTAVNRAMEEATPCR